MNWSWKREPSPSQTRRIALGDWDIYTCGLSDILNLMMGLVGQAWDQTDLCTEYPPL